LRYCLSFTMVGQRLELVDEAVENERAFAGHTDAYFFYRYQNGHPTLNVRLRPEAQAGSEDDRTSRKLRREDLKLDQSVLSQRKDPDQYPELTYLGSQFAAIQLYREWNLGRYTAPRMPQRPDLPEDVLLEDASNLGLVLNSLQHQVETKRRILEELQRFYSAVEDVTTRIQGGTVQIFLHERGLRQPVPATRLSDGTLRYLCLLAILCHPQPPPLVCLEEPELGLHPDIIPALAELLIDASRRTQLVVTTHSDTLVSALSHLPEAVLVCERDDQGSRLQRLEPAQLKLWLEKYSLGQLWRMGEIGGNRW
jgi:predicted ATPase